MTLDDLRKRLHHLGVMPGSEWKARPPAAPPVGIETLVAGQVRESAAGSCYEVTHIHAPDTLRGALPLGEWLAQDPATIARMGGAINVGLPNLRRLIFLDTETTGLGGVGTLVFMVGIGFFNEADQFEVHQFFLRSPSEEPAMLSLIHEALEPDGGLVTFNGRTFDVPMLASRYILARKPTHVGCLPNLDLLPPARRLWKRRLPSCALGALERDVLGIRRTQADVPGWLIPTLYQQYLQTGDGREMARVFYHNEQDILSMITLAATLSRAFGQPDAPALPIEDRLSLARWYESQGALAECEVAYRVAMDEAPDAETRHEALSGLAALLKRLDRRGEAVPLWEYLADLKLDTAGHEELAKHYEWHEGNLAQALKWTEQGLRLAESWRPGLRRTEALRELNHRHKRLVRKLVTDGSQDGPDLSV